MKVFPGPRTLDYNIRYFCSAFLLFFFRIGLLIKLVNGIESNGENSWIPLIQFVILHLSLNSHASLCRLCVCVFSVLCCVCVRIVCNLFMHSKIILSWFSYII